MSSPLIRVAVNGYGVIGKRVADAITLQPDMQLVGIADVAHDYRIAAARRLGYDVFAGVPEVCAAMVEAGIDVIDRTDAALGVRRDFLR